MSDTPQTKVVKCPEPFAPLFAESDLMNRPGSHAHHVA